MQKVIRVYWKPIAGVGLEHLELTQTKNGIQANSVVIGSKNQYDYRIHYSIEVDNQNKVRRVLISLLGYEEKTVSLTADGKGNWFDKDGKILSDLKNCYEIDISATPFTNTLAIRRLNLAKGESADLSVVYISVPDFTIQSVAQRYTCLNQDLYKYEGLFRKFEADLPLDEDGLMIDYPETFVRVYPNR